MLTTQATAEAPTRDPLLVGSYAPPRAAAPDRSARAVERDVTTTLHTRVRAALVAAAAGLMRDAALEPIPGLSSEQLRQATEALFNAIDGVAQGGGPAAAPTDEVPYVQVLDELRHRFVRELATPGAAPDGGEVVRALSAVERVREYLERDAAQRFLARLTGPEALRLLVELTHDMRSPLAAILFLSEGMRTGQSGPVSVVQGRQLGLIYGAALGLSETVNDLLELARAGGGLLEAEAVPFSLGELVESVLRMVRPVAEEKRLLLEAQVPDPGLLLRGQPTALRRILLNLVTNALKYTPEGRVEMRVERMERGRLRFAVRDTGRGIPPHVMANLCDPVRAAPGRQAFAFSTAGLGLAICQRLLRAMGSELQVETAPEQGTCFSFTLELPPAPRISGGVLAS